MRVLMTGITGTCNKQVMQNLVRCTLQECKLQWDPQDEISKKVISSHELEDHLPTDIISFLDSPDERLRTGWWMQAFEEVMAKISHLQASHVILGMHMTYKRHGSISCPSNWGYLASAFQPDVVVTLIDDVHDIWSRVVARDRTRHSGSYLRLREILDWRSCETLLCDKAADYFTKELGKKCENVVVAVKSPAIMLFRLLFKASRPRIYASYPITHTRHHAQRRAEIDQYRNNLHERFAVFDPLAIDEKVSAIVFECEHGKDSLKGALPATVDSATTIQVDRTGENCRWPLSRTDLLLAYDASAYPVELSAAEVHEASQDVDRQIRARDFRFISQADAVAAYKPWYKGSISQGVTQELSHAMQAGKGTFQLQPPDRSSFGDSPFTGDSLGPRVESMQELLEALENLNISREDAF